MLVHTLKVISENKTVLIIKSEFHYNLQSIQCFFSLTLFLKISNYMRFQNFIKTQAIISATNHQTERALFVFFYLSCYLKVNFVTNDFELFGLAIVPSKCGKCLQN